VIGFAKGDWKHIPLGHLVCHQQEANWVASEMARFIGISNPK